MDRPYADKACELMEIAGANKNSVTVLNAVIEEFQVRMSVVNDLLDAAKEQSFEWPTTDAPAARHGFDGDFFFYEHGLLSYLGYHVGGSGKTKSVRQQLLDCVFLRRVPNVGSDKYMSEWGEPETARRLQKMADTLAALARNAKRKTSGNYAEAISDWETDLEYLYTKYYVGRFDFVWPRTSEESPFG